MSTSNVAVNEASMNLKNAEVLRDALHIEHADHVTAWEAEYQIFRDAHEWWEDNTTGEFDFDGAEDADWFEAMNKDGHGPDLVELAQKHNAVARKMFAAEKALLEAENAVNEAMQTVQAGN